jgi:hypothetical protein
MPQVCVVTDCYATLVAIEIEGIGLQEFDATI